MSKNISHFAAIFPCNDPEEVANWYKDKLGFTISFKWENPASYVVAHKEEIVSIHFTKSEKKDLQPSMIYVFCHNVDAVFNEVSTNYIESISTPGNRDYGMRDFDVFDPWGNRITFGKGLDSV